MFNRNCGLRLKAIHCRCRMPCDGFDPKWFGAVRMEPRGPRRDGRDRYEMVYPVANFLYVIVPKQEAA